MSVATWPQHCVFGCLKHPSTSLILCCLLSLLLGGACPSRPTAHCLCWTDLRSRVPFDCEPTRLNVFPGLLFIDTFGALAPRAFAPEADDPQSSLLSFTRFCSPNMAVCQANAWSWCLLEVQSHKWQQQEQSVASVSACIYSLSYSTTVASHRVVF